MDSLCFPTLLSPFLGSPPHSRPLRFGSTPFSLDLFGRVPRFPLPEPLDLDILCFYLLFIVVGFGGVQVLDPPFESPLSSLRVPPLRLGPCIRSSPPSIFQSPGQRPPVTSVLPGCVFFFFFFFLLLCFVFFFFFFSFFVFFFFLFCGLCPLPSILFHPSFVLVFVPPHKVCEFPRGHGERKGRSVSSRAHGRLSLISSRFCALFVISRFYLSLTLPDFILRPAALSDYQLPPPPFSPSSFGGFATKGKGIILGTQEILYASLSTFSWDGPWGLQTVSGKTSVSASIIIFLI